MGEAKSMEKRIAALAGALEGCSHERESPDLLVLVSMYQPGYADPGRVKVAHWTCRRCGTNGVWELSPEEWAERVAAWEGHTAQRPGDASEA